MNLPCYDSFAFQRAPGVSAEDPSGVARAIGRRLFHAEVSGRGILGVSERFDLSVSPQQGFQLKGRGRLRFRSDEPSGPSATQCGRRLRSDSLGGWLILPATSARVMEASLS